MHKNRIRRNHSFPGKAPALHLNLPRGGFLATLRAQLAREIKKVQGCLAYISKLEMLLKEATTSNETLSAELEELRPLVETDPLTQVGNRLKMDTVLSKAFRNAKRYERPLTVVMIDIDHFKNYNDHYGHTAGDDTLYRVAQAIKDTLKRPADIVCRYGGEEFLAILPDTDLPGGSFIAEKIRMAIERLGIAHVKSEVSDVVTLSLGFATVSMEHATEKKLVKDADGFLYTAKRDGRNRVCGEV